MYLLGKVKESIGLYLYELAVLLKKRHLPLVKRHCQYTYKNSSVAVPAFNFVSLGRSLMKLCMHGIIFWWRTWYQVGRMTSDLNQSLERRSEKTFLLLLLQIWRTFSEKLLLLWQWMHFFRSKALISTLFLFRNIASFVEIIEDGTRGVWGERKED